MITTNITYIEAFQTYNKYAKCYNKPLKMYGDVITLNEMYDALELLYECFGIDINNYRTAVGSMIGWAPIDEESRV